jgi:type I restriction enzyme S subunit
VQPNLNLHIVKSITVPLPPVAEQDRIVTEVERLVSDVEAIEGSVAIQLARAVRLSHSILKRAFEGKLVPQDPNDEPASVLLDRLHAERQKSQQSTKVPRVRRRQGDVAMAEVK